MDAHEQTTDTVRRGINRRTVVKGAVATAWTVPLVQVVAAPAFAAVSGKVNLGTTSGTVSRSGNTNTWNVSATVRNSGGGATVALTATATWTPNAGTSSSISAVGAVTGSSWTASTTSWTANTQIAPAGQETFNTTVTIKNAGNSGNVKGGTLTVTFADPGTAGSVAGAVSGS